MSLSIMQEIFILLEDEKEVPFFRLTRWGRPARGALSKLKNLGWITRAKKDKEIYYQITDQGESYVDEVLGSLKNMKAWDKKWRLVMFNIPETKRALRDKLRRALAALDMGILQSSVWVSPYDIKDVIDEIDKKFKLQQQIKYFEVTSTANINEQIIEKSWDMPAINEALEKFIKEAEWTMKAMGKGNGDRFNAKKLIFEYALILKNGPILPMEFIPHNETRQEAHEIYLELRRFVV